MQLYALLIGIDRYEGSKLYHDLDGCVRDITQVENMLKKRLRLPDENIQKLLAPLNGDQRQAEFPTYENIVNAFKQVAQRAQSGDQVYIHYSGHGGRVDTSYPEVKGRGGLDETLVPTDIKNSNARHVRDLELGHLISEMLKKQIIVTLVLDSCHSGGATRGEGKVRGIDRKDPTDRPKESLVAKHEELVQSWRELTLGTKSGVTPATSGWLPASPGYVLLAACQAHELANEFSFDGIHSNGAMTYWILDSLNQLGPGLSYRMLYNRVVGKVHSRYPLQTPQLEGEADREVFGANQIQGQYAVNVLQVERDQILLDTGLIQGIGKGTQFAIYPASANLSNPAERIAIAEILEDSDLQSWATLRQSSGSGIEIGTQAVLIGRGIDMQGRVRFVEQNKLPENIDQQAAFARLDSELSTKYKGFLHQVTKRKTADFQIAINENAEYEIRDPEGKPYPNLRPAISIQSKNAPVMIGKRLMHLFKYQNVRLIDNTDPDSVFARVLLLEIGTTSEKKGQGKFSKFKNQNQILKNNEEFVVRIINNHTEELNVSLLVLQPDWGISKVYPINKSHELLLPGEQNAAKIALQPCLQHDYDRGTYTLKMFASIGGSDFHWLELPALDTKPKGGTRPLPKDSLEDLLRLFFSDSPTRSMINVNAPEGVTWGTVSLEVDVEL